MLYFFKPKTMQSSSSWLVRILALALMFSASLPQGYMLSRGADNVVEIVVCRGFGQHQESLFLDISTGEYLDFGTSPKTSGPEFPTPLQHSNPSQDNPCEFTLASFDAGSALPMELLPFFAAPDISEVLRRWDIVSSSFQYPNPRGPPAIS